MKVSDLAIEYYRMSSHNEYYMLRGILLKESQAESIAINCLL
jgi:hypothetical protein